jgi:glycosyltransferase involved in cell wall biosynthesis
LKISICIPTYNRPILLKRAINSVFAQTYSDYEIIVCHDGIDLHTSAVVKELRDPRVKYYKNSHQLGIVGNVNECIVRSTGEIITFLEDDCQYVDSHYFQKIIDLYTDTHECAIAFVSHALWQDDSDNIVVGKRFQFYPQSSMALESKLESRDCIRVERKEVERLLYSYGNYFAFDSFSMRRSVLEDVGLFDRRISYAFDWNYWFKLAEKYDYYFIKSVVSIGVGTTSQTQILKNNSKQLELTIYETVSWINSMKYDNTSKKKRKHVRAIISYYSLYNILHLLRRGKVFLNIIIICLVLFLSNSPMRGSYNLAHTILKYRKKR